MAMNWLEVVKAALEEGMKGAPNTPITGSRFRGLLEKQRLAAALEFPHDPGFSFSRFLEQFPDVLLVHRRPKQDILVVPADRAELLTLANDDAVPQRIREDLFWALTHIPNKTEGLPYYSVVSNSIEWLQEAVAIPRSELVALPRTDIQKEVDLRRTFADSADLPETVHPLINAALDSTKALVNFTNLIRAHGLTRKWHLFRMKHLLTQLKEWSSANNLPWQSEWLDASDRQPTPLVPVDSAANQDIGALMTALGQVMTTVDLTRISIPLDLVLKAWNRKP